MIRDWLEAAACSRPEDTAVRELGTGQQLSYAGLMSAVEKKAHSLAGRSWVELQPVRSIESVVEIGAVLWAGAVPVFGRGVPSPELPAKSTIFLRMHTSGSTDKPKPIDLEEGQIRASVEGSAQRLRLAPGDSWLCPLPLRHIGGLSTFFRALHAQAELLLAPEGFDAAAIARAVASGQCSHVSLVPFQLRALLDVAPRARPSSRFRVCLVGGDALEPSLKKEAIDAGWPVAETWGMTECASQVATTVPGSREDGLLPLPGVRVLADTSPPGALIVEGKIAPGGRIRTTDFGRVGEDGRVFVEGRIGGVIVSGGENLSAAFIATRLRGIAGVKDAHVIGERDPKWGQRPKAFLVPHDTPLPSGELRRCIEDCGLRKREQPILVEWVPSIPRTELGKVVLKELLERPRLP